MSDQPYTSPQANLANDARPASLKRTASTVWGIIFMILAVIGFLATVFGLIAVMALNGELGTGMSPTTAILDTVLSMIGKVLLFLFSLALLLRASWVKMMCLIGLVFSLADTTFKAILVIPGQANAAFGEAAKMGTYLGFYVMVIAATAIYLGYWFYLKSAESKLEFKLK